jgi:hypothetical protein
MSWQAHIPDPYKGCPVKATLLHKKAIALTSQVGGREPAETHGRTLGFGRARERHRVAGRFDVPRGSMYGPRDYRDIQRRAFISLPSRMPPCS